MVGQFGPSSSFDIPSEIDTSLATAIWESADLASKTHTGGAASARWRAGASTVHPPACSLLIVITCNSTTQHNHNAC